MIAQQIQQEKEIAAKLDEEEIKYVVMLINLVMQKISFTLGLCELMSTVLLFNCNFVAFPQ